MPGPITVDDLLLETRQQLDESNEDDVGDDDILRALNRGQRKACSILTRKYHEYFLAPIAVTTTGSVGAYSIPESAYGRRINQITVTRGNFEFPLTRVAFSDLAKYKSASQVSLPSVYAIVGRQYYIRPIPVAAASITVWITKAPETLVVSQGRISTISVASNYVLLDALGDGLTASTADLGAYVNIVDAQTGEIKVSLQIASTTAATSKLTFKSSGLTAATVYNRTIDVAIPTTVEVNDLVCAIQGTCVPDLPDSCVDYMTQFAAVEIRRRFMEDVQAELIALKDLETEIERQWVGRQLSSRVANNSRAWSR